MAVWFDFRAKTRKILIQIFLRYLRRPYSTCSSGNVVIFVKCARGDFFERNWIRKYARKMADQSKSKYEYDLIFLLGNGPTLIDEIEKEAQREDDILIGGFIDNYENLPIKTYLGYQYFAEVELVFCRLLMNSFFSFVLEKKLCFFKIPMLLL